MVSWKVNLNERCLSSSVLSDRDQIYIGDDNALTLEISAENQGEGAYEAELHVYPPPQADFTGVVRSQVTSPGGNTPVVSIAAR